MPLFQSVHASYIAFAMMAWILFSTTAPAGIIYVDDDATAGNNDGTSWPNAYMHLQSALIAAHGGDEIRVGQGIYKPAAISGNREASFDLVPGVIIQGGYAGTGSANPDELDPQKWRTILSGDINGNDDGSNESRADNSYHVLRSAANVGPNTIVRGLVIAAGHADSAQYPHGQGAGLLCDAGAAPKIEQCEISDNRAFDFAGAFVDGAARLHGCRFADNTLLVSSTGFGAGIGAFGGAEILNCTFINNTAMHGGGGAYAANDVTFKRCQFMSNYGEVGGALYGGGAAVECTFKDNTALDYGGAARSSGTFINCLFANNVSYWRGGAMHLSGTAINCIFSGNRTSFEYGQGGAVYVPNSASLINCTIVGNSAFFTQGGAQGGGVYKSGAGHLSVVNTIIWYNVDQSGNNETAQLRVAGGTVDVANSCIKGWTGSLDGANNFPHDPQFVNAAGPDDTFGTDDDDLRLQITSPCRDRGELALVPLDDFDIDADGRTNEMLPRDAMNLRRIVNGYIDVGAIEWQRGLACAADIWPSLPGAAGDGAINTSDLICVIQSWGPCDQAVADLNDDGVVNTTDMLQVLKGWGSCASTW